MKLEVQPREDHQVKIIAEFDQEEFENYFRRAARKVSRETRIPGFRPGKAPVDVVRRLVGDESLNQQALEDLVDEQYSKILDEAKINPGGAGALDEIIATNPPKLAFIIPLEPEVTLGDYKSIRKEYTPPEISDAEVEDYIKRLRLNYSTAEPVERAAEKGDLVYAKFSGKLASPAEGEDENVFPERPAQFIVSDETIEGSEWPFPGFTDVFAGMSANDEKTVRHTFSEDEKDEALRGKEVDILVQVQSVKSIKLPEMDDDFAKTVGQFETVDELRSALKDQMGQSKKDEYDDSYYTSVIDDIITGSTIKYAPQMVDHEVEHMLEHLSEDLGRQGMEMNTYFKMIGKDKDAFVAEEVRPSAIKRLERSLIIEQISRDEELKLAESDYNLAISETIQAMQSMPQQGKKGKPKFDQNIINNMTMNSLNRRMNQMVLERIKAIGTGEAEKAAAEQPVVETVAAAETTEEPAEVKAPAKKTAKPRKKKAAAEESESSESEA